MTRQITVRGMRCARFERTVEDALLGVTGIESAADREAGTAAVEGDASVDTLVDAVANAGYEVSD